MAGGPDDREPAHRLRLHDRPCADADGAPPAKRRAVAAAYGLDLTNEKIFQKQMVGFILNLNLLIFLMINDL